MLLILVVGVEMGLLFIKSGVIILQWDLNLRRCIHISDDDNLVFNNTYRYPTICQDCIHASFDSILNLVGSSNMKGWLGKIGGIQSIMHIPPNLHTTRNSHPALGQRFLKRHAEVSAIKRHVPVLLPKT